MMNAVILQKIDVVFNCSCIRTIILWTYWQDTADAIPGKYLIDEQLSLW